MPLFHMPLQIGKQDWADAHQKECSCLIGMDALGTSEHEEEFIIMNYE